MTTYAAYPTNDAYYDGTTLFNGGTSFVAGFQSGVAYGIVLIWDATGIPQGATINSCVMDYTKTTGSGTPDIRVHFEDADTPALPANRGDAAGRTLTSSYANITSLPANGRRSTPDMSASLQQVVDRGGFAEDAIQLFWRDNKGTGTGWIQGRLIEQTGTGDDPYLTVDYTETVPSGLIFRRRTRSFKQRW